MDPSFLQREDLSHQLVELAPDAMVVIDREGKIVLINAQTETLFGYARDEILGKPVEQLIPSRFDGAHQKHRAAYVDNPTVRPMCLRDTSIYGLRKDGSEFMAECSLSPLATTEGQSPLVFAAIRDLTESNKLEMQLRQTEKMEAVGQLAGGVAHDLNNLLVVN